MPPTSDPVLVVGAGIVGLATALALRNSPAHPEVTVIEKERGVVQHQTGHNSGVIHSGPYYRPGSLKARMCIEGRARLLEFCDAHRIRYEICGKVIAAVGPGELPALEEIHRRGVANGVAGLRFLTPEMVHELEPNAVATRGLHVPTTGIVDYREVGRAMAEELRSLGVEVVLGAPLESARRSASGLTVVTPSGDFSARYLVNCAGLYSDRVARLCGTEPPVRIVPFRGEYYVLRPERRSIVRGLLYPVPDPDQPFLGVHFTRRVGGEVEAGPNAVLAFAREGYTRATVDPAELAETLTTPGFPRMAYRFWRSGLYEMYRSFSKPVFVRSLQKLVPSIVSEDLEPGGSGVRAQALAPDGRLLDDFVFAESETALHVLNAPSPAATASLAIGRHVADRALARLGRAN
ncbi:MAG TPA: L-2-hydroxyglutarate oxidase [Thermoplasmata archaeon]|nr:L-2-hydroxyglutarate oxidase [Thermoplasmata archaeon]